MNAEAKALLLLDLRILLLGLVHLSVEVRRGKTPLFRAFRETPLVEAGDPPAAADERRA